MFGPRAPQTDDLYQALCTAGEAFEVIDGKVPSFVSGLTDAQKYYAYGGPVAYPLSPDP